MCVNSHPFSLLSQASESMSNLFALEMKVWVQKHCHHLSSKCSYNFVILNPESTYLWVSEAEKAWHWKALYLDSFT